MWRFRHLIVLASIVAVAYYFTFMLRADWKVLAVLVVLMAAVYVGASMADPIKPKEPPRGPRDGPSGDPPR